MSSSRKRRFPPSFSYRALVASASSPQRMSNSVCVICRRTAGQEQEAATDRAGEKGDEADSNGVHGSVR
jgi:hypothetical protein